MLPRFSPLLIRALHPPFPADPTAASAVSCSLPSPITAYFRHSSYSTLLPSPIRLCASSLCLDSSLFGRRLHFRKGVCGGVQEGAAAEDEAGKEEGEGVGAECRYLHRRTIARSTFRKFRLSPSRSVFELYVHQCVSVKMDEDNFSHVIPPSKLSNASM
ncbi:hypothetical protein RHMOL_Rhmol09G0121100 [Rhododendron molle]|uniref:Uncharacterized protein n=1 Tax=Rhododendron molle TaxID=49168 RepID=A0ACC0MCT6_RHOML|nr:hypothetical protein RHMOL_Rhmol09G0121100 [Rhododendron molle]